MQFDVCTPDLQAMSVDFEFNDFALTVEHAVHLYEVIKQCSLFESEAYTKPIPIKQHIEIFFLRGSCSFHMMAIGRREHIKSVTIEHPNSIKVTRQ